MATTGNGVWTPDASSNYNLTTDLASMAASIDTALERRANSYKGTQAQRVAFTTAPEGSIWVDTNGDQQLWVRRGTGWFVVGDLSGYARYDTSGGVNGQWVETGASDSTSEPSFRLRRSRDNGSAYARMYVSNASNSMAEVGISVQDLGLGVYSVFYFTGNTGEIRTRGPDGVYRPVPFATASGGFSAGGTANTTFSTSITFPSGRFTKTPDIFIQLRTSNPQNGYIPSYTGESATGFTAHTRYATTTVMPYKWFAIQMEP